MLCDKCGKNNATTYIKQNINGVSKEMFLCSECAEKLGSTKQLFGSFGNFFMPLFDGSPAVRETKKCGCGTTLDDIVKTGMVGCEKCYETFKDELMRSVKKMHGAVRHRGRLPDGKVETQNNKESETTVNKEKELKKKLADAIKAENFEEAARLRDEIKELNANE